MKLTAEPVKEVEDLLWLRDGLTQIVELVSESLQVGSVLQDG